LDKLEELFAYWDRHDKQCSWFCPICFEQCGGVIYHGGLHQCPEHYNPDELTVE
jgi:hypothetical protein